jgi:hypothetical protein
VCCLPLKLLHPLKCFERFRGAHHTAAAAAAAAGNVVAIGLSALVCVVVSLIKPQNYDWALMKEIPTIEDDATEMMEDVSVTLQFFTLCNMLVMPEYDMCGAADNAFMKEIPTIEDNATLMMEDLSVT